MTFLEIHNGCKYVKDSKNPAVKKAILTMISWDLSNFIWPWNPFILRYPVACYMECFLEETTLMRLLTIYSWVNSWAKSFCWRFSYAMWVWLPALGLTPKHWFLESSSDLHNRTHCWPEIPAFQYRSGGLHSTAFQCHLGLQVSYCTYIGISCASPTCPTRMPRAQGTWVFSFCTRLCEFSLYW